jgi:hypothetical protein
LIHTAVSAQQNLINVPSSEVTEKNKIFFQQQINFNELIQSNTTVDFGLGKGFECGINVLGLNFSQKKRSFLHNDSSDTDPYNPLIMINSLKQFSLSEKVKLSAGMQGGINYKLDDYTKEAYLLYSNLMIRDILIKKSEIIGGVYYNSKHYGGSGERLSAWMGMEVPLLNKFHFMAESVLGNNALSYTSLGFIYYPKPFLPLTFGFQIPNTSRNSYSFVFELTYVPTK